MRLFEVHELFHLDPLQLRMAAGHMHAKKNKLAGGNIQSLTSLVVHFVQHFRVICRWIYTSKEHSLWKS